MRLALPGHLAMLVTIVLSVAPVGAQVKVAGPAFTKVLHDHKPWVASILGQLGGQMADAATTSYALDYRHVLGVVETNPVIVRINQGNNQMFGPGGYSVKLATWGFTAAYQYWLIRRADRQGGNVYGERLARKFVISNWVTAAGFNVIAIHNARVSKLFK